MGYACNCDCCRGYCAETNFGPIKYCIKLDTGDSPPPVCKKGQKPGHPQATTAAPAPPIAALPVVGGELASQQQNPGQAPSGSGGNTGGQPSGVPGPPGGGGSSSGAGQAQAIPVVGSGLQQGASGAKP